MSISTVLVNWFFRNQLKDTVNELEVLYQTDMLTGLYNRRGFLRELESRIRAEDARGKTLTLFAMDMDRLKSINDVYGHHEGDYAIQCLAQAIEQILDGKGICARFGGDEFAFARLDEPSFHPAPDEIREHIETVARKICGQKAYLISASIGACSRPVNGPLSLDQMQAEADRALYADKRNRSIGERLRKTANYLES